MLDKYSGQPIKDRGIRWEESYRDKSASLKKHYEEVLGPGSYYRWEGHDSSTSTDYYVSITPGHSAKKGYYFFSSLRKIPEEHGSSGKKFKTQDEAISYAIKTWNIPTPESPPHKPYAAEDLAGKILSEKEATMIQGIVRQSEREGDMRQAGEGKRVTASLEVSGKQSLVFPSMGKKDIAAAYKTAMRLSTVMGIGAALGCIKQFGVIDLLNQKSEKNRDAETGLQSSEVVPKVATCRPPNQASFEATVNVRGIRNRTPLYKFDKKTGDLTLSDPAIPEAVSEGVSGYRLIRLGEILTGIEIRTKVGWRKYEKYQQVRQALTAGVPETVVDREGHPVMGRNGQPQEGIRIPGATDRLGNPEYLKNEDGSLASNISRFFNNRDGTPRRISMTSEPTREQWVSRDNPGVAFSVPADLMGAFRLAMGSVGTVKGMPADEKNAIKVWSHFEESGTLDTPEGLQDALRTPMFEDTKSLRGSAIVYNSQTLEPIGIKVSRTPNPTGQEEETSEGSETDVLFQFAPGVVERLLSDPAVQQMPGANRYEKLRLAFLRDAVPVTNDMFVDSRTATFKLRPIRSVLPSMDDNLIPRMDEHGRLIYERRDATPQFSVRARTGRVRVYDDEKGEDIIIRKPPEVAEEQSFRGTPIMVPGNMFVLSRRPDPETGVEVEVISPLKEQEITLHDVASQGRFMPGQTTTVVVKPSNASSAYRDIESIYKKGQDREGIFVGVKQVQGVETYAKGHPDESRSNPDTDHLGPEVGGTWPWAKVSAVEMRDGTWLEFPVDGAADSPAVRALRERREDVVGYKYITQRQWPPKPPAGIASVPKEGKPVEVPRYERQPDGSLVPSQGPPIRLTAENFVPKTTGRFPTLRNMEDAISVVAAKFGLDQVQIGHWTRIDMRTLRIADEKFVRAMGRIEAVEKGQLSPEELDEDEVLFSQILDKNNAIPGAIIRKLAAIGQDPADYEPKRAPIYGVWSLARGEYVGNATFGTEEGARDFIRHMASQGQDPDSFEVRTMNRKADGSYGYGLPLSWEEEQAVEQGEEAKPFVAGLQAEEALRMLEEDEEPPLVAEPEKEPVPLPEEAVPLPEEAIAEPLPEEAPAEPLPEQPAEPLPEEELVEPPVAVPQEPLEEAVPQPVPVPVDREAASSVERLVKLANRLDEAGRTAEADAVDKLISVTAKKAVS